MMKNRGGGTQTPFNYFELDFENLTIACNQITEKTLSTNRAPLLRCDRSVSRSYSRSMCLCYCRHRHSGEAGILTDDALQALRAGPPEPTLLVYNSAPPQHVKAVAADAVEEMRKQTALHSAVRPLASLLEFTLPWDKGETTAPEGDVLFPVWGKWSGTRARLVAKGSEQVKAYDHTTFEEQMFHFNTITRATLYDHPVGTSYSCQCSTSRLWVGSPLSGDKQRFIFLRSYGLVDSVP